MKDVLPPHCTRVSLSSYEEKDRRKGCLYLSYGSQLPSSFGRYFVPEYLTYSDYSGSTVERSNLRVFCEEFAEGEGVWWWNLHGGYGTCGVIVRTLAYRNVCEVREFFDALENYPLASDGDHSQLEVEIQSECWESYGLQDFRRHLEETYPEDSGRLDAVPDSVLSSVWWDACSQGYGDEVVCETAISAHFDFDAADRHMETTWRELIVKHLHDFRACSEHDDCKLSRKLAVACKSKSLARKSA